MTVPADPTRPTSANSYAQERIEWLKAYLELANEFAEEVRFTSHEPAYSKRAKALLLKLELDRREASRILDEVDFAREFAREHDYRKVSIVLLKAIREWEILRDEIRNRVAKLTAFLTLARQIADLEKTAADEYALMNASSDPILKAASDMDVSGNRQRIREGRDALTMDQPEVELLLRGVHNSFGSYSLAAGVSPIINFIADQVLQAIGKYKRLTRPPRLGGSPPSAQLAPPPSPPLIADVLNRSLRPAFKEPPKNEREVQDQVEQVLRVMGIAYARDKEVAPVGPTSFRPDFTVESQNHAIEVKFAHDNHSAAEIQRELAEDVAGYGTKWEHLLAVVYDVGAIRDPEQMKRDNEAHFGVSVVIVKH